jgi:dipeptidyl aminopeptidase/acylaminoacyl peptidase
MQRLDKIEVIPLVPMTPVGDPQIKPDGSHVLFTYSEVNMEEDKYDTQIWLLDLNKRKPVQFTFGKENSSNPRWSPDGKSILFTSKRPSPDDLKTKDENKKKAQLFVIPADGGEARQITQVEEGVQSPAWSPDGRKILFRANVFKGEKATEESDVKIIRRMKYKHDGKGFSVGMYTHLFLVPSKGGKARQLTDGLFDVDSAEWSPDGKSIVFVSNFAEDADRSLFRNIYAVPTKGGEPQLLWEGKGSIGAIAWASNGRHLAFVGRDIENPELIWHKNAELYILPVDGGEAEYLTSDLDRTARGASKLEWAPDSKQVYIAFPDQGGAHVYKVSVEGGIEAVTEGKIRMDSFSIDDSGTMIAFNAGSAVSPTELWISDGEGQRQLTEMNRGLLKKLRVIPPEEFWFTASDGIKVQGWIVKPRGLQEGKKYPACIQIHGGPRGAYGYKLEGAEHEFQVLADHGYAVVYTNPRASIGYGEQFAGLISGAWGERDYLDIMEATDYVIENYSYVDADRFGVLGGSYGGFMTNWIVGHTDRYKAAVTMRSISNWYSFHGTSDIGWMTLTTHEINNGKDPWDDLELCMEKSPITYVKNMTTPLLIIHSENDYRCPMEQGEQLYIALKKLGRTTEFVRFPGEPHGLSRTGKPKHRKERLQHIVRWFDRYLK